MVQRKINYGPSLLSLILYGSTEEYRNQEVGKGYSPLIQSSNNDNLLFASVAGKSKEH